MAPEVFPVPTNFQATVVENRAMTNWVFVWKLTTWNRALRLSTVKSKGVVVSLGPINSVLGSVLLQETKTRSKERKERKYDFTMAKSGN
jgi:anti-sigma-K factor RskA